MFGSVLHIYLQRVNRFSISVHYVGPTTNVNLSEIGFRSKEDATKFDLRWVFLWVRSGWKSSSENVQIARACNYILGNFKPDFSWLEAVIGS